jgi:hypothetical protein
LVDALNKEELNPDNKEISDKVDRLLDSEIRKFHSDCVNQNLKKWDQLIVKLSNNKVLTPSLNETSVVLTTVKNFVEGVEQNNIKYSPHSEKIVDIEHISKYTQSGGFAPEFFKT